MLSKPLLCTAAASVVAYCIYFDHKRRNAPDFQDKLRKKRQEAKDLAARMSAWPSFEGTSIQEFFMNQMARGDELMTQGNMDGAAEAMARAMIVAPQQGAMLANLQVVMPELVALILAKMPQLKKDFLAHMEKTEKFNLKTASVSPPPVAPARLVEIDDVE